VGIELLDVEAACYGGAEFEQSQDMALTVSLPFLLLRD